MSAREHDTLSLSLCKAPLLLYILKHRLEDFPPTNATAMRLVHLVCLLLLGVIAHLGQAIAQEEGNAPQSVMDDDESYKSYISQMESMESVRKARETLSWASVRNGTWSSSSSSPAATQV